MTQYIHPYGATHYVIPRADINNGRNAMVKEADYFYSQNGHREEWGSHWIPVVADGIKHANLLAWFIGSKTPFPHSINFDPPNRRTVAEINAGGFTWGRRYEE